MQDRRGHRFAYDEEGQLTDAWYGPYDPAHSTDGTVREDHFSYDQLGNRTGSNYVANRSAWITFTRKDNRLNQYRQWYSIVQYDDDIGDGWGSPQHANGVTMMDGNITGGYNALNQPMMIWSANNPGGQWLWFGYDPLCRCVKRWYAQADGSGAIPATYFVYDGWNVVEEGYSPWSPVRFYIQGGRVDEIVQSYNSASGLLAYHYYDASGHCTLLTDGQGSIKEQYYYDAFGYPYFYNESGSWLGSSPHGNRFLLTGREWLSELRLYDFRNRLYQPELGRFLQPDPKEFGAGDYNLYRYCHNDPVNKTDPMGEEGWTDYPRVVWSLHFNLAKIDQVMQIKHDAERAGQEAERQAKEDGTFAKTPDIANAVRHLEGSARLTGAFGANKAKEITDIHEDGAKDKEDSAVEQQHNALGREIGATLRHAPALEIHKRVIEATKTDRVILKIHEKDEQKKKLLPRD
jgi:RHS repeat-associated protein